MEYLLGAVAVILLLWACSGSSGGVKERYSIKETDDDRYYEVTDNHSGKVEFVGTRRACEQWIQDQGEK